MKKLVIISVILISGVAAARTCDEALRDGAKIIDISTKAHNTGVWETDPYVLVKQADEIVMKLSACRLEAFTARDLTMTNLYAQEEEYLLLFMYDRAADLARRCINVKEQR